MFNFFTLFRNKEIPSIDFSILKSDMHSHLIPSVDDGSKSIEESIRLINKMKSLGFSKIITTPHTMSDVYKNSSEDIIDGMKKLKMELDLRKIKISFDAASEYYIDFDFTNNIGKNNFLTFGHKYILVEFSFFEKPNNLDEIIFNLQSSGYNVVFAHPERYLYLSMKDYRKFVSKGVFLQLNLLSITGYYSTKVLNKAKDLINEDLISFVGTDCHNESQIEVLKLCFTNPLWHKLSISKKLLNRTL
tara:strand:- start:14041 stop:14778 length:738 start_codon:yes stop_codon:yes gene_type:complete